MSCSTSGLPISIASTMTGIVMSNVPPGISDDLVYFVLISPAVLLFNRSRTASMLFTCTAIANGVSEPCCCDALTPLFNRRSTSSLSKFAIALPRAVNLFSDRSQIVWLPAALRRLSSIFCFFLAAFFSALVGSLSVLCVSIVVVVPMAFIGDAINMIDRVRMR